MPRPTRSKVTSTRPAAGDAVPQLPAVAAAAKAPGGGGSSSDIYDLSDREKNRKRGISGRNLAGAASVSSHLAGRVGPQQRNTRGKACTTAENLSAAAGSSPAVEVGRRLEMAATRRPRGAAPDASGLDLDDDMFGKMDSSFGVGFGDGNNNAKHNNGNDSLSLNLDLDDASEDGDDNDDDENEAPSRGQRSTDTSSFNVALFKRGGGRPRTSSIVGRDDAPIRPSSRGAGTPLLSSTLNFSVFKRRAREPSILGTAQKDRHQQPRRGGVASSQASSRVPSDSGLGIDDDPALDSGPEAESTPLTRRRTRSMAVVASAGPAQGRVPSAGATTRKRKSLEDQGGSSKRRSVRRDEASEAAADVSESIEADPSSSLSPAPRVIPQPSTPMADDTALAPPASSGSSNASPTMWPSLKSLARNHNGRRHVAARAKTPVLEDDDASDASSPPSLTHSPDYRGPKAKAGAKPRKQSSPKVTTVALTSLLPRRRPTRANSDVSSNGSSEEDSDASEERGNDDDELVYAGRTRSRARPLGGSSSKAAGKQTTAKESEGRPSAAAKKRRAARRTYGSRSLNSDKENEGEEEDLEDSIEVGGSGENTFAPLADDAFDATEDSIMMAERLGEELKNAARKFKEVDKWELSFEEAVEQPSSPKDAR